MFDEARHTCAFVGGLGCPQVAIGAAIEGWKVLKIMRRRGMLATEYWTRRKEDRAVQVGMTAMEAATDEHDARAMKVSERTLGGVLCGGEDGRDCGLWEGRGGVRVLLPLS